MEATMDEKTREEGTETQNESVTEAVSTEEAPKERRRNTRQRRGEKRDAPRRERSEFDQQIIEIRRVTRVVAGGRRFSFSIALVIGDKRGRVGIGLGKATDTALAINKAARDARKNMITVPRTEHGSIAHDVSAKYASSFISLFPSPERGLVAGSAVRTVLEFAGITDITSKIQTRTKSKIAIARATIEALKKL
jgi:small subunit ribosomal protein S5